MIQTLTVLFLFLFSGLGLGLNAIENVGREIREQGQERELRDNRAELQMAKMKEAELEQRLRMLEMQQK